MNLLSWVVLGLVLLWAVLAVIWVWRHRGSCGDCSGMDCDSNDAGSPSKHANRPAGCNGDCAHCPRHM